MTILCQENLPEFGPFIRFIPLEPNEEVPEWKVQEDFDRTMARAAFSLPDDLLGLYCSATNSTSPFDPMSSTLLSKPHEIYRLASEILLWAMQLARSSETPFRRVLGNFDSCESYPAGSLDAARLKHDLLETLLHLAGLLNGMAANGRQLYIFGI